MTKDELVTLLEPLTLEYKETGIAPTDKIVAAAKRWMDEGDHKSITGAFSTWDTVMALLVEKHGITKRSLN